MGSVYRPLDCWTSLGLHGAVSFELQVGFFFISQGGSCQSSGWTSSILRGVEY